MSNEKQQYKAMVYVYGGAAWGIADTKGEAMKKLKTELRHSWRHIIDVDKWLKSGTAECDLYHDAGTDKHSDDTYIATVPLI